MEVNPQGLFKGKQAIGNLENINIECNNSFEIYLDGERQDSFYRFRVRNKTPTLWFHMKNSTEQAIYEFVKPRFEWSKNSHTRVSYTQGHKMCKFLSWYIFIEAHGETGIVKEMELKLEVHLKKVL